MTTSNETDSIVKDDTGDDAAYTQDQLAQMFNAGMTGDTVAAAKPTADNDAKPGASTDKVDEDPKPKTDPEKKEPDPKEPDPANTLILAKDGKHTIDFSHLEKAREQRDTYKAEAEEAKRQLAELQAQAQSRADAGKPPTPQDQLLQKVKEAIDEGVDPAIFGDYSEEQLAKGILELNRRSAEKIRAEVKAEVIQEVRAELAPFLERQHQDAASAHANTILKAHPDVSSVLESTEFADWMGKQPSFLRDAMTAVLDKGSAQQVVEVLDSYKAAQSSPKTTPAPSPQAAAQKVVEQLKPQVPASPSEIPGGRSGAGTLAERLEGMNEVALFNAWNAGEISQETLNSYLSRKS